MRIVFGIACRDIFANIGFGRVCEDKMHVPATLSAQTGILRTRPAQRCGCSCWNQIRNPHEKCVLRLFFRNRRFFKFANQRLLWIAIVFSKNAFNLYRKIPPKVICESFLMDALIRLRKIHNHYGLRLFFHWLVVGSMENQILTV